MWPNGSELYAGVTLGNDASVRVLQRLGFEHLQDVENGSRWRLTTDGEEEVPAPDRGPCTKICRCLPLGL
jgi:hypothetical protein